MFHRTKNGCRLGRVAKCKRCVHKLSQARKGLKKEYDRLYLKAHRDSKRIYLRDWRERNNELANSYSRRTPQSIMANNLRGRIRHWVIGSVKSEDASVDLTGTTLTQLRNHLESTFKPGMSWDNYGKGIGKWCIDHIDPMSNYDLTDPAQQRIACHYTNMQALWFDENGNKGHTHTEVEPDFVPLHLRRPAKRKCPASLHD
jgi:hypothetical protein